jgi:serine/threonine protein kinase
VKRFVGRILDQRYQIGRFIAEGARGAVFQGCDLTTQNEVAIKILDPKFASQPELEQATKAWLQTTRCLNHPDIVTNFDVSISKAGIPIYIVMELVNGGNLCQQQANLTLLEILQIMRQIFLILDYAHQRHIFHRGIKPENILLGENPPGATVPKPFLTDVGLPTLTDLGYARMLYVEPAIKSEPLKRNLSYISPEQAKGKPVDARSDIYALGILLYELTVGHVPFEVSTVSQAIRYHNDRVPPPPRSRRPELPQTLEQIILKALAKNPDDRFQSIAELAEASAKVISEIESTSTKSKNGSYSPQRPSFLLPKPLSKPPEVAITVPTEIDERSREPIKVDYNVAGYLYIIPGDSVPFAFVVTNQTDTTKEFELSVEGIPPAWISNLPARLKLSPHQPQEVRFNIVPPRAPSSRMGQHNLAIQIRSSELPGVRGVVVKSIVLRRFIQFSCHLLPEKKRLDAGSTGRVVIHNQGNSPESFLVRWHEETGQLRFKPPRERLQIPPDKQTAIPFQAVPNQTLTIGAMPLIQNLERYPFSISVSLDDELKTCEGEIITRGLVPTRFGLYFVMSILLLTLTGVLWLWLVRPPTIRSVVLNPLQPNCNQPFTASWIINENAWGVKINLLANSTLMASNFDSHDQFFFPEGVAQPTTLTVEAKNWFGSDVKPAQICTLDAKLTISPPQVREGESVVIQWNTINAQTVLLEPFGLLNKEEFTGSRIDTPRKNTVYKLTATNGVDPPKIIELPIEVLPSSAPEVVQFKVEPSVVTLRRDKVITLTWQVANADITTIQPDVGTITPCDKTSDPSCNERVLPAPIRDTVYTLVAQNAAHIITNTAKVTVVTVETPEIINFSADPPVVTAGVNQSVILSWKTSGANSIRIEPDIGNVPPAGEKQISAPVADATYTLTAENGEMAPDVEAVTIKVQAPFPPVINSFTVVGESQVLIDEDNREQEIEIVLSWDVANVSDNDQVTITRNFDGKTVASRISGSTIDRVPAISREIIYTLFAQKSDGQTATGSVTVNIQHREQ